MTGYREALEGNMSKDRKVSSAPPPAMAPATKGASDDPQDLQGNDFVRQQMAGLDDKFHEPVHAASPTARKSDAARPPGADTELLIQRASRIGYEVMVDDTKLYFRKRDTAVVLTPQDMARELDAKAPREAPGGPLVVEEMKTLPDGSVVRTAGDSQEVIRGPSPTARKSDRPGWGKN